jgi:hypothetical protein
MRNYNIAQRAGEPVLKNLKHNRQFSNQATTLTGDYLRQNVEKSAMYNAF